MAVISIENVWKEYRLGVIGSGTLVRDLQSWWARLRGREDPNAVLDPMASERQLHGVRKDRFWALRDISLEVQQGDVLGVIGRNGAGKSTLLKVLSRVTTPTRGQIKIKGRVASLLEVGTGFHPELTGRENVFLNGAILGMNKQEIRAKFDEIVAFAELEKFIDTPVKRYSSGMYVRLAFAVAAHLEPEILVVDEVLAVGDVKFQEKCLGKMEGVAGEGRTILFVSHNMGAVNKLCKKGVFIDKGEVGYLGTAVGAVTHYLDSFAGAAGDAAVSFDPNPSKPVQFLKLSLHQGTGQSRFDFNYADDVYVDVTLQVNEQSKDYLLALLLTSYTGASVYATYDCDHGPSPLVDAEPGVYTYRVRFPKKILAPGSFFITPKLYFKNEMPIDVHHNAISFSVDDKDTFRAKHRGYVRGTNIAPEVDWEFLGKSG